MSEEKAVFVETVILLMAASADSTGKAAPMKTQGKEFLSLFFNS